MRFEPNVKTVEMYGIDESQTMTIAATGKVFYAFISGLYSNKVESVVRETTSNARDGHIKKGNVDVPFIVHAPTSWEPFYSVRDFGCSMTHDFVMRHFTTIGYSDKEQSDTMVGTWGFGSKSPFALTSQFTVTCWKDGEQRIYNCHIGEDGKPNIALMANEPSDDPDGVQVRFDVKNYEINDFHRAIQKVALSHVPSFKSNLESVRSRVISEDHGDHYFSEDARKQGGPFVEIGCVWYPIDFGQLNEAHRFNAVSNTPDVVIRSDISTLAITPSRESLEYNKKTKDMLEVLLLRVVAKHTSEFNLALTECIDIWDAVSVYCKFNSSPNAILKKMINEIPTKFGKLADEISFKFTDKNAVVLSHLGEGAYSLVTSSVASRTQATIIVMNDLSKPHIHHLRRRVADEMERRAVGQAVIISIPDVIGAIKQKSALLHKDDISRKLRKDLIGQLKADLDVQKKHILRQVKDFGCNVVIDAHSLPEPIKRKTNVTAKPYTYYHVDRFGKFQKGYKVEPKDEGINIVFPVARDNPLHLPSRDAIEACGVAIGKSIDNMIGIANSSFVRFLRDNPDWIDYREVFNEDIEQFPKLQKFLETRSLQIDFSDHDMKRQVARFEELISTIPDTPPEAKEFIESYDLIIVEKKRIDAEIKSAISEIKDDFPAHYADDLYRLITGRTKKPLPKINATLINLIAKQEAALNICPEVGHSWNFDFNKARIHISGLMAIRAFDAKTFTEQLTQDIAA